MKIKKLEWVTLLHHDYKYVHHCVAKTDITDCTFFGICEHKDGSYKNFSYLTSKQDYFFDTLEEAKQSAQQHFNKLIGSCIDE